MQPLQYLLDIIEKIVSQKPLQACHFLATQRHDEGPMHVQDIAGFLIGIEIGFGIGIGF
jgi:hypothetical protein